MIEKCCQDLGGRRHGRSASACMPNWRMYNLITYLRYTEDFYAVFTRWQVSFALTNCWHCSKFILLLLWLYCERSLLRCLIKICGDLSVMIRKMARGPCRTLAWGLRGNQRTDLGGSLVWLSPLLLGLWRPLKSNICMFWSQIQLKWLDFHRKLDNKRGHRYYTYVTIQYCRWASLITSQTSIIDYLLIAT